jgi:hypothetical protein
MVKVVYPFITFREDNVGIATLLEDGLDKEGIPKDIS